MECPDCGFQALEGAETCAGCGHVFQGKKCIVQECGAEMAISAVACPACGVRRSHGHRNDGDANFVRSGTRPPRPLALAAGAAPVRLTLLAWNSYWNTPIRMMRYRIDGFSIPLPIGVAALHKNRCIHSCDGHVLEKEGVHLPSIIYKDDGLKIFIDAAHPFSLNIRNIPKVS